MLLLVFKIYLDKDLYKQQKNKIEIGLQTRNFNTGDSNKGVYSNTVVFLWNLWNSREQ